jgi:hypothetical protein
LFGQNAWLLFPILSLRVVDIAQILVFHLISQQIGGIAASSAGLHEFNAAAAGEGRPGA